MNNIQPSPQVVNIECAEDLREAVKGSDLDVVQLRAGRLQGSLTHVAIENLGMSLGRFAIDLRAHGLINQNKITLGMILSASGRVTHWGQDVHPGDLCVFPAGAYSDGIYGGGASYAAITMDTADLVSVLGGEERLADAAFWDNTGVWPTDPLVGEETRRCIVALISGSERRAASAQAIDFLRRSVIEAFTTSLVHLLPPDRRSRPCTGTRLVHEVDHYLNAAGERPVHISELCSVLKVSRRSLHRAFVDTLDVGPIGYLRRRRLSTIHAILKRSDPATTSIADVAFEHGFPEPGRFSGYYRSFFGETPSKTLRSALPTNTVDQGDGHRSSDLAQTAYEFNTSK
jgi:AraC-like DNA-binding protein